MEPLRNFCFTKVNQERQFLSMNETLTPKKMIKLCRLLGSGTLYVLWEPTFRMKILPPSLG
jgi:hypothetical protein